MGEERAIELEGVGVKFRLMHERISTLKETVINLLRGRRYVREDLWALRGVDLQVEEGSTVGVVGRNGSGKSTLLRVVAGVMEPTEGEVSVRGEVSSLLELGAGFDPELSGTDNVYLSGSLQGIPRRVLEERFPEIVAFSGLESFIDVPVKSYSAGMYVRLAFAIATEIDPDVLLIDEILTVGDEAFQGKCLERIREFREGGKTLLIVSHAAELLKDLCDRLVFLDGGRLKADGEPGEVIEAYHRHLQELAEGKRDSVVGGEGSFGAEGQRHPSPAGESSG